MKRILALLALLALPAAADMVATNGTGDELRLMDAPCTNSAILDGIKPEYQDQFQRGQATVGKQTHALCWIDTREGYYFVFFENGQSMPFPITAFVSSPGT